MRQLSRKSELAQAFRYMQARWPALAGCFDDGRLALDNNPAERTLCRVAVRRLRSKTRFNSALPKKAIEPQAIVTVTKSVTALGSRR